MKTVVNLLGFYRITFTGSNAAGVVLNEDKLHKGANKHKTGNIL
ncbi:hypothetical protein [Methanosarcina barkeri]|nr:hypothetical protein [Methanosarcina barkeri]